MSPVLLEAYEAVIGLEVHVQLATATKIFCGCSTAFGAAPNTQVCPVCLGHPGVLPVLNRAAVEAAVRFGLAVGATIRPASRFARKNYFYPDLPKGYQISQYESPVLAGGMVPVGTGSGAFTVPLHRAHLEEDAGKSMHPAFGGGRVSLIDLNRAGVPLLEVVTEPALDTPAGAHAFLVRMRQLVRYLGISDGNMEEGSLRCDANVSVRHRGSEELNPKTEIKNLNSFRHVEQALTWEIERQAGLLEDGGMSVQATRLWDEKTGRTRIMRTKEDADDYRYFPDPDLRPLVIDEALVREVAADLPELPWVRERRLEADYGLARTDALLLAGDRALAEYFERAAARCDPGRAAHWVTGEVLRALKEPGGSLESLPVTPEALGTLVTLVEKGTITGRIAKSVFATMVETGDDPQTIIAERGLTQVSDPKALSVAAREVLDAHPGPVAEYFGGKETTFQFFIGQVMRRTGGRANPDAARRALLRELEERKKEMEP